MFTPPETGTEADDGLLTASEIATLTLATSSQKRSRFGMRANGTNVHP